MKLSTLPKTWIFDLDGTLVVHNGYHEGVDRLLPGVRELFEQISTSDYILILTARTEEYKEQTIDFLKREGIRFDNILFNIPVGERIIFNDDKPSGLKMALAVNVERDKGICMNIELDADL